MSLSVERLAEIALPINRARYHLGNGVSEEKITRALIGKDVLEEEIPDVIALAKERNAADLITLAAMSRRSAYGYMAAGAGLLVLVWIGLSLSGDSLTGLGRGRSLVGCLLGVGLVAYGVWRWAFNNPAKLMFRDRQ